MIPRYLKPVLSSISYSAQSSSDGNRPTQTPKSSSVNATA